LRGLWRPPVGFLEHNCREAHDSFRRASAQPASGGIWIGLAILVTFYQAVPNDVKQCGMMQLLDPLFGRKSLFVAVPHSVLGQLPQAVLPCLQVAGDAGSYRLFLRTPCTEPRLAMKSSGDAIEEGGDSEWRN